MARRHELRCVPKEWKHPTRFVNGIRVHIPLKHRVKYHDDVKKYDKLLAQCLRLAPLEEVIKSIGDRPTSKQYSPVFSKAGDKWVHYLDNKPATMEEIHKYYLDKIEDGE